MSGVGGPRSLGEECGISLAFLPRGEDAVFAVLETLHALQHRGQESAGISWRSDDGTIDLFKDMGLVSGVFTDVSLPEARAAIGHTRYATSGDATSVNAGPFVFVGPHGPLALAHNGHLSDVQRLREHLQAVGVLLDATTDTAVLCAAIAHAPGFTWVERILWALEQVEGSFSLTILTSDALYAVRDSLGNRPLSIGRLDDGWIVSSESCAFTPVGARLVRDVRPGEIVSIDEDGVHTAATLPRSVEAFCSFEYLYLSRPDSYFDGRSVYDARREMGRLLAQEHPAEVDLVAAVPDSGIAAALGYAAETGHEFAEVLFKNRYVARTFIQPSGPHRDRAVSLKFGVLSSVVQGKRIALVDDSLVRGTTMRSLVGSLVRAGAAEVHLRIAAPPVRWPCFLGVDIPTVGELIAHDRDIEEIRARLGAHSLGYLSAAALVSATGHEGVCTACFTGRYPANRPISSRATPLVMKAKV